MEALLSLAFDNLSSYDGPKIRKGLRQVEGLLAQICLSSPSDPRSSKRGSRAPSREPSMTETDDESPPPTPVKKSLSELSQDPAFREFFKLQEGFEWNVASRLINALDRLMGKGYGDGQNDLLILATLDLIQGVMLLHPPSKVLFSREQNMNVGFSPPAAHIAPISGLKCSPGGLTTVATQLILDLLDPVNCPAIQSATCLTLVVTLIDTPRNTRAFEALDGLLTVTSLFKSRSTSREVKLKLVEFLYFYLMPEVPSIPRADARDSVPAMLQRSPSKLAGAFAGAAGTASRRRAALDEGEEFSGTMTTEAKQELLGRHLTSVEDLVRDLQSCTPFGGVVS